MQNDFNVVIDRKKVIKLPLKFNGDIIGHYKDLDISQPCNVNCSWKILLYPEFFVKYIRSRKVKYTYKYFHSAKLTPFAKEISKEASVKTMFKCIFELCFKPVDHFFRYQVCDKLKNYIGQFKSSKSICQ